MYKCQDGYFDKKNNEFIITNLKPIRPLKNYLWNEKIVAYYDQFGCGLANGKTGGDFRALTYDPKFIYIKDLKDNSFYSPNRNFFDLPFDKHECHVGLGYQRIISEYNGLRVELTFVIPKDDYAEIMHIKVKNISNENKNLHLYSYNRPFVNLTWHIAYSYADIDTSLNGLLFKHIGFNIKEKNNHVLVRASEKIKSFDVSDLYFKGLYNEISNPKGVINDELSNKVLTFDENFSASMQFEVNLEPKEEKEINIVSCFGESEEQIKEVSDKYVSNEAYYNELNYQKQVHDNLNEKFILKSDDEYIDLLINVWLKRQITLGKTWGRVYGKGFRDIMQDTSSFLSLDPVFAKEKIKHTLSYQFENGNTIRQFDPIFDYPYQDGPSWIPATVLAYLKETNDFSLLEEKVPYYNSNKVDSIFNHMENGIKYLINNLGQHGLVKWGGGDWNDSIDNAGMKGIGESVWLSIATVKTCNEFIEIINKLNIDYPINDIINAKNNLELNIIKYGFEGDRYIYGITDENEKIGSKENEEGKIYLNTQTWSILANINSKEIQDVVMDSVEKYLKCNYGYLQSYPAYSKGKDSIGRMTYFTPGTYENGSVYNHGVAFKIYADLMRKNADLAYESCKLILPINEKNKNNGMEPYAIGNMYFGPSCPSRSGYSPSCWITGTAGWIYRDITEMMMGIRPDYDGLIIDPCLPSNFDKVSIKRIYQGQLFDIEIVRNGHRKLVVDGFEVSGNKVFVNDNLDTRKVIYNF